jgi:hypothetical protein
LIDGISCDGTDKCSTSSTYQRSCGIMSDRLAGECSAYGADRSAFLRIVSLRGAGARQKNGKKSQTFYLHYSSIVFLVAHVRLLILSPEPPFRPQPGAQRQRQCNE